MRADSFLLRHGHGREPFFIAAFGTTIGPIIITPESPRQEIADWGYDIKQRGEAAALDATLAEEIFVDDGMTVLRIPILAGPFWGQLAGHPGPGKTNEPVYTDPRLPCRRRRPRRPLPRRHEAEYPRVQARARRHPLDPQ
jgi:hypothetical protein